MAVKGLGQASCFTGNCILVCRGPALGGYINPTRLSEVNGASWSYTIWFAIHWLAPEAYSSRLFEQDIIKYTATTIIILVSSSQFISLKIVKYIFHLKNNSTIHKMISKHQLYSDINTYFDNPVFTKIKNTDDYSIYMCKLNIQLGNEYRYLVCIVPRDVFFIGVLQPLSSLQWTVFQTRSLVDAYSDIKSKHTYYPKQGGVFNSVITRKTETKQEVVYTSKEIPVEISLLINTKNLYDYPPIGTLNSALETYNTVLILV